MVITVEAPSDARLDYIRSLCHRCEQPLPDVIYSKTEASLIIESLLNGSYNWRAWAYVEGGE